MSTKLRKCRRSLAAALDQAAEEDSSWSPNSVFSLSLVRISQNGTYVYDHWTERPDCMCFGCIYCFITDKCAAAVLIICLPLIIRPFSINRKEDFLCCTRSAILQDLHGLLGQSYRQELFLHQVWHLPVMPTLMNSLLYFQTYRPWRILWQSWSLKTSWTASAVDPCRVKTQNPHLTKKKVQIVTWKREVQTAGLTIVRRNIPSCWTRFLRLSGTMTSLLTVMSVLWSWTYSFHHSLMPSSIYM